ncbi:unnamed protein product [Phaeothamnion confervicola]
MAAAKSAKAAGAASLAALAALERGAICIVTSCGGAILNCCRREQPLSRWLPPVHCPPHFTFSGGGGSRAGSNPRQASSGPSGTHRQTIERGPPSWMGAAVICVGAKETASGVGGRRERGRKCLGGCLVGWVTNAKFC